MTKELSNNSAREGDAVDPAAAQALVPERFLAAEAAETLLVSNTQGLMRKAIDLALAGRLPPLMFCLERLLPAHKDRPVPVAMPQVSCAADLLAAINTLLQAATSRGVAPRDVAGIVRLVDATATAKHAEMERRLDALTERLEACSTSGESGRAA